MNQGRQNDARQFGRDSHADRIPDCRVSDADRDGLDGETSFVEIIDCPHDVVAIVVLAGRARVGYDVADEFVRRLDAVDVIDQPPDLACVSTGSNDRDSGKPFNHSNTVTLGFGP